MLADRAGAAEPTLVARRQPVADDGGQHGLHVLGKHTGVPVHQGPGLRGTQQRNHGARRKTGVEVRAAAGVRGDCLDVVEQCIGGVHERHVTLEAQQHVSVTLTRDPSATLYDTLLYLLQGACDAPLFDCNDDFAGEISSRIERNLDAGTWYFGVLGFGDTNGSDYGAFRLDVVIGPPQ